MPNLHWGELLLILLIVVIIFGASRLPMIGEGLGKAIRGFKRSMNERDEIEVKRVPERSSAEAVPGTRKKKKRVVEVEVDEDADEAEVIAAAKAKARAADDDDESA